MVWIILMKGRTKQLTQSPLRPWRCPWWRRCRGSAERRAKETTPTSGCSYRRRISSDRSSIQYNHSSLYNNRPIFCFDRPVDVECVSNEISRVGSSAVARMGECCRENTTASYMVSGSWKTKSHIIKSRIYRHSVPWSFFFWLSSNRADVVFCVTPCVSLHPPSKRLCRPRRAHTHNLVLTLLPRNSIVIPIDLVLSLSNSLRQQDNTFI